MRSRFPLLSALFLVGAGASQAVAQPGMGQPAPMSFERLDPRFDALIPQDAAIEVLGEGIQWAEGPVWIASDNALLLSDVVSNVVFRWKEGEGLTRYFEPSGYTGTEPFQGREPGSNGLALDSEGRLLLAQHGDRRIARREADGSFTTIADRYDGKRLNSPNDLVFGPNGDLYFTDPPYGLPGTFNSTEKEQDFNGVYRVTPDGTVHLVTSELSAPNGIGVTPDGKTLIVANSDREQRAWVAYPINEDGSVGEGSVFREVTESGPGTQDGFAFDAHGNLWATAAGGVHVIAPDGTLLGRILTNQPTANVAWGGDGSDLFITSNRQLLRVRTNSEGMVGFQHR